MYVYVLKRRNGADVSTFSTFWRQDFHEVGGMGMRRRLKRDLHGSAHLESTYLKFLAPPSAPVSGSCASISTASSASARADPPFVCCEAAADRADAAETSDMYGRPLGDDAARSVDPHDAHGSAVGMSCDSVHGLVRLDVEGILGTQSADVGRRLGGDSGGIKYAHDFECELVTASCIVLGILRVTSCALLFRVTGAKEGMGDNEARPLKKLLLRPCRRWGLQHIVRLEGKRCAGVERT